MKIRSSPGLHYPITVVELLKKPQDEVKRLTPLFSYTYETTVTEGSKWREEEKQVKKKFPGRYDSSLEGVITDWCVGIGTVITRAGYVCICSSCCFPLSCLLTARYSVDLVEIEEPCSHHVQFGGLCTECGKDMTECVYRLRAH